MNPGWSWGKTYFGVKSHIMVHWRYLANTSKQIYDDQANSAAFGFQDIIFNSRNLLPVFYALDKFNYIKDEKVISSDIWVQQIWWTEALWCVGSSDLGDPPQFWELLSFYLVPDTRPTLKPEKCQTVYQASKNDQFTKFGLFSPSEIEKHHSINCLYCLHSDICAFYAMWANNGLREFCAVRARWNAMDGIINLRLFWLLEHHRW